MKNIPQPLPSLTDRIAYWEGTAAKPVKENIEQFMKEDEEFAEEMEELRVFIEESEDPTAAIAKLKELRDAWNETELVFSGSPSGHISDHSKKARPAKSKQIWQSRWWGYSLAATFLILALVWWSWPKADPRAQSLREARAELGDNIKWESGQKMGNEDKRSEILALVRKGEYTKAIARIDSDSSFRDLLPLKGLLHAEKGNKDQAYQILEAQYNLAPIQSDARCIALWYLVQTYFLFSDDDKFRQAAEMWRAEENDCEGEGDKDQKLARWLQVVE